MANIKATDRNDVTAIRRNLHRNIDLAVLGQTSDASSPVFVNDRPGYWWVRFIQAGGTYGPPVQVRGCTIPMATNPGVPVKMGVVEGEKAVIGPDFVGLLSQGVNPTQNAVVDPNANNPAFVNQAFIATAFEQILEGTLKVGLRGAVPLAAGVFVKVEGQFDFTGNVPSAGSHCLAMTAIQSDLATTETQYSTSKSTGIPLDLDDLNEAWGLMSDPTTNKPLWSWDIGDGQTALIEANRWMDNRQFLNWDAGGGSGDVVGPASAVNNDFAQFDTTTGKLIKDGGLSLSTDGTFVANSDSLIPSQKATKSYVDAVATGLSPKASVVVATAAALPSVTYANGSSGVGATLTAVGTGVLTVDGHAVALNERVLVKDQVAQLQNGIYLCTLAGAIGVAFILTRTTDNDTSAEILGSFVFVEQGTVNASSGWVNTNSSAITIGTTAITFTQFSGAGEITVTAPIVKTGNNLSLTTPLALNYGGTGAALDATGPGVPVQATSGAVFSILQALSIGYLADGDRLACRCTAIGNINIASPGTNVFDGQAVNTGDRIFLYLQSSAHESGPWIFQGGSSPLTRPVDYPSGSTVHAFYGLRYRILFGTQNSGVEFYITSTAAITIDTTAVIWSGVNTNAQLLYGTVAASQLGTGTGATFSAAGTSGAVPQPQIKDNTKLLSGALTYIRAMITLYSQGADVVLTNPNTETTIIGTGLGSVTIPANNLNEVGRAFEIRAVGYVTRADSSTTRIRIKLGGTTLLDTGALTLAWGTSHRVEIYAKLTTKSTGSSGTINGQGYVDAFSAAGTFTRNSLVSTAATTEDLTGTLAGDVTWLFSGSNAGNIVTITNLDIIQIAG